MKRIVLVGGGTGGATTPLLALAERLRELHPDIGLYFIGTSSGPERALARAEGISFHAISAGKLRRYFSFRNVSDVAITAIGFFQALRLLRVLHPEVIVSVGSYVAVPVVWAGRLLGIPSIVHQQDLVPGLSNRLCAPHAHTITTSFEESLRFFPKDKAVWTGNPVRKAILAIPHETGLERFRLLPELPVLLVFGGGTGSLRMNELLAAALDRLLHSFQVIHITGGRTTGAGNDHPRYHRFDFLTDDMPFALAAADFVVCRAGLATLTELGVLGKPAIVVPMPHSHQEANASFFADHGACVTLQEDELTAETMANAIVGLWNDRTRRTSLSEHIRTLVRPDAAERIVGLLDRVMRKRTLRDGVRDLQRITSDIRFDELLSRHSNFKIGGPADVFVTCTTKTALCGVLAAVHREGIPHVVLGGGTNVVFSDAGFRGVIIKIKNREFSADGETVTAGAGTVTGVFVQQCHAHGLTGTEFLVGIYGTIGGAVRGNAGSFGKEMKDIVTSCEVINEQGMLESWTSERLRFAYRDSIVKRGGIVIVSVTCRLSHGDMARAKQTMNEYLAYKRAHQPINLPSAGCMFKNVTIPRGNGSLRNTFSKVIHDDVIPAWALIKEAELSGKRIGGIQISEQHANFFINVGNGTAEQIIMLKSLVKQRVRDTFGVQLEEEVQFIGC